MMINIDQRRMICFFLNFDFSPTNNGGEKKEFIFYHHRHHFENRFQWKKILPHFHEEIILNLTKKILRNFFPKIKKKI